MLPLGPDLICKAISAVKGGMASNGGSGGITRALVTRLALLFMLCLDSDPARRSVSFVSWIRLAAASMAASWSSSGRIVETVGVLVERSAQPNAAPADIIVALRSLQ